MLWMLQNFFPGAAFHDLPAFHHHDPVCHLRCDAHIVRDQKNGGPILSSQFHQLMDNLRLHGNIQRTGRFICQKNFRLQDHGQGNRDSLIHSTGQLCRTAVEDPVRVRKLHLFKQRCCPIPCICLLHTFIMRMHSIIKLSPDFAGRIKRCARLLEYDTDSGTADAAAHTGSKPLFSPIPKRSAYRPAGFSPSRKTVCAF